MPKYRVSTSHVVEATSAQEAAEKFLKGLQEGEHDYRAAVDVSQSGNGGVFEYPGHFVRLGKKASA